MLELKSLVLGLVFAVGVFAVKTGAGLTYFVAQRGTARRKVGVLVGISAAYVILFLFSWYVCSHVDVVFYFNKLRIPFQSGMTLHVMVALGMFIWGWALLRRNADEAGNGSWGWLSLVIPCPICGSVVFFTTGFLVNFFPDDSLRAVLATYALFAFIMIVTIGTLSFVSRFAFRQSEDMLGYGMLFIASYFVLSILLVPHFSEVDKVYRLAAFHSTHASPDAKGLASVLIPAVIAVSAGFLSQRLRRRTPL